jgi:hypothetical protein
MKRIIFNGKTDCRRRCLKPITLAFALLLAAFSAIAQNQPSPEKALSNAALVSPRAQVLVNQTWTNTSFAVGIAVLADRNETKESRALAMEVLQSNRRKLNSTEMSQLLNETTAVAKDKTADETLSAEAVRTMGNVALTMKELGQISEAESKKETPFLMEEMTNIQRGLQFRASAINSLGILKIKDASPLLRNILESTSSLNDPEVSRSACLSLMRIDGELAVPTLRQALRTTADPTVFGTAAFAIGQIKKTDSMIALMENQERFPDSGSCDAALVDLDGVILDVLTNAADTNLIYAIRATKFLWRDGQRERYIPLLERLLTTAPTDARKVALDRLIDEASTLQFEREKQQLSEILSQIRDQPELADYGERIERRLSATILQPIPNNGVEVQTLPKGGN